MLNAIERIAAVTEGRRPVGIGHDDADDVDGTIASDDAIGFNPLPLLRACDQYGAEVVVIGQVAGILHGSTELTGDLDLLWSGSSSEASAMSAAFGAAGAELFDDDGRPVPCSSESFGQPKIDFRTSRASGDCCSVTLAWGDLDVGSFFDRAESTVVDGIQIRYICCTDLIAMRRAVGRPKDLRRAAELASLCSKPS